MWPRPGSWAGWGPARCTWAGCSTAITPCAAEEVFFRGALYAAAGGRHPVALSSTVYSLATTATRNPALVLASAAMGTLLGLQRQAAAHLGLNLDLAVGGSVVTADVVASVGYLSA